MQSVQSFDPGACSKLRVGYTLIDLIILGIAALPLLLFKVSATPYHRGFYCDDESIMYPYRDSTVTSTALYTTGFVVNIILILVFELIYFKLEEKYSDQTTTCTEEEAKKYGIYNYFHRVFSALLPFVFGAVVEHLTTDIGKYSIGRLRPHFLNVCQPDTTKYNCSMSHDRYVQVDACTGDPAKIREARLSFPSGHASFSTYAMFYAIFYLQSRLRWKSIVLLRPFIQLIFFYMAFYTCLSRISDYKHHWSDVLSGAIIGITTAILVAWKLSNLFEERSLLKTPMTVSERNNPTGNGVKTHRLKSHVSDSHNSYHSGSMSNHSSNNSGKVHGETSTTNVYYVEAPANSHTPDNEWNTSYSKVTTQL